MTKPSAGDAGETSDDVRAHVAERPRPQDQLYDAFPNTPVNHAIDPRDGLPSPVIPHSIQDALAPPLSRDTLICLGDFSRFVLRNEWGDVVREYSPEEVERAPGGEYRVRAAWWRRWFLGESYHRVEPIRPPCAHYAAQLVEFPHDQEHRMVVRHCHARRVDYGDFLSLNDTAMFACDLRLPVIGNNAEAIQRFDEMAIARAAESRAEAEREDEVFDVERALEEQRAGGIFGGDPSKDDEA